MMDVILGSADVHTVDEKLIRWPSRRASSLPSS
jgi:hypothetical protein